MNLEKARDNFSAYYEGTLDKGLSQAFERALSNDAQVQAEYRAFSATMQQLENINIEVAEPEFDLHDRIMARLDRHRLEERNAAKPSFFANWRMMLTGAAAAVLCVVAFNGSRNSGVNEAKLVPVIIEQLDVTRPSTDSKKIRLNKKAEDAQATILNTRTQSKFQTTDPELINGDAEAQTFEIILSGDPDKLYVALPGTKTNVRRSGTGTILDLARAAADTYAVPVLIAVSPVDLPVSWNFSQVNARDALNQALHPVGATAGDEANGLLRISKR